MFESLITQEIAYLAACAITIMLFIGRIPVNDGVLNQTKVWKNFGIFMLLLICISGSFVQGVGPDEATIGDTLIFGIMAAACAKIGRNVLKPVFMSKLEGKDQ